MVSQLIVYYLYYRRLRKKTICLIMRVRVLMRLSEYPRAILLLWETISMQL